MWEVFSFFTISTGFIPVSLERIFIILLRSKAPWHLPNPALVLSLIAPMV